MKLKKPARVGNTIFGKGVDERLVIARAQREYEYRMHERPDPTPMQRFLREVHDRKMPGNRRLLAEQRVKLFREAVRDAKRKAKPRATSTGVRQK